MEGIFKGWLPNKSFGFIKTSDREGDVFLHINSVKQLKNLTAGDKVQFDVVVSSKGRSAENVILISSSDHRANFPTEEKNTDLLDEEIEDLDASEVSQHLLEEIASWKREAKAEDSYRYFWHVREVDQISQGKKYFVIGRKGSGKTAICEHFNRLRKHNVFAEKLSFKQFPFNELYSHNVVTGSDTIYRFSWPPHSHGYRSPAA